MSHVLLVKTPLHSKWHVLDVHMNILRSLVYVGLYLYIWWLHHSVQPCFLGCYTAKKKSMFVGWYRHIYIICFTLTPLTNANGFRFGNSMNGTKKSAEVDTVDVCVIGFTTSSQKEMEYWHTHDLMITDSVILSLFHFFQKSKSSSGKME